MSFAADQQRENLARAERICHILTGGRPYGRALKMSILALVESDARGGDPIDKPTPPAPGARAVFAPAKKPTRTPKRAASATACQETLF